MLRALNGPVLVTGRADLIKQVFGANPDNFSIFAKQTMTPILGPGSLLVMEGDAHRSERKMLSPVFSGERMKAYGPMIRDVALQRMQPHLRSERFEMLNVATEISLEVIVRAIFGGDDPETVQSMFTASRKLVRRSSPFIFFSKKMQFRLGGISPWDRYVAARQELFNALDQQVERADRPGTERTDILYLFRQVVRNDGSKIPLEHLRQSLVTLLFAGHETSALALSWAFYHLHRYPTILAKLKASLHAEDDLAEAYSRNSYLKAVVLESLRMNPIITETLRLPAQGMTLGDYEIPAGTAIALAAVLAHYNPRTYPDPDEFRPDRFLEGSFSPFEFFPFGGGHRRCIGAAFALNEMQIVLGTLLRNYDFDLLERRPVYPRRRNVTMGPSTGIAMRIKANSDSR